MRTPIRMWFGFCVCGLLFVVPLHVHAQEPATTSTATSTQEEALPASAPATAQALALSVTPPLIQLSIGPGEFWASTLKVPNPNDFPLTVYGSVVDFQALGDEGRGTFVPRGSGRANSLSSWVVVESKPITIQPKSTGNIPFTVDIPESASPGGHYAAVLIGTRPADGGDGPQIKVSTFVSSLLFVRIEGDVDESGFISAFSTNEEFLNVASTTFSVTFKNTGNVHVRPTGAIHVTTRGGRSIATIPFNESSFFGSVLPEGIRTFEIPWVWDDARWYNIGPYIADVSVSFGVEAQHNVTASTTFWYVPRKPLVVAGGVLFVAVALVVLTVRIAVIRATRRRMPRRKRVSRMSRVRKEKDVPSKTTVRTPRHRVDDSVIDLRKK